MLSSANRNSSVPPQSEDTSVRRRRIVFLDSASLDQRVRNRTASIDGCVMRQSGSDDRFILRDAVRVLGPVGMGPDLLGMTGREIGLSDLLSMGATINAHTVRIGAVQYDVQLGVLAQQLV